MEQDQHVVDPGTLSPRAVSLRENWGVVPGTVLTAIGEQTGRIHSVAPAETGYSSHIAATLDTEQGRVFVKGMRTGDGLARMQQSEAVVNPHVTPIGPRLLWRVVTDGWDVLGFEYKNGRIADFGQSSDDLPLVVATMAELARIAAPGLELPSAEDRWAGYLDRQEDAALLHGDLLLHTDWHHTNLLVTPANRMYVVDWALATRGAAWIDPACWVVWLVYAGHSAPEAERWAAKVHAWSAAPGGALDVFASVLARYWQNIADNHPNTMTYRLRDAAAAWAAHRHARA
ncbi:phosphotransferase family protein [Streptomyces sp. NBC_01233]|uniref:phosphotransferase family protein n=1 Tax=Streptomyces sp. NBC_01233 TaxID=2903787 RepID=UPI002E140577|nr:aminoglycoside phosphotransferase family protein [Streptomyces sp. NBC_01233]